MFSPVQTGVPIRQIYSQMNSRETSPTNFMRQGDPNNGSLPNVIEEKNEKEGLNQITLKKLYMNSVKYKS